MAPKGRNLPPSSKPPTPLPIAGGESSNPQPTGALPQEQSNADFASLNAQLRRVEKIFQRNKPKALKIMKDICLRNENCAFAHRLFGHLLAVSATINYNRGIRQRHFKDALESAQKAVSLSPKSIEYAAFHAKILFDSATDAQGYEEGARECERGLSIEDPVDPATDNLFQDEISKGWTAQERIVVVREQLQSLLQRHRDDSLSAPGKNLGKGIISQGRSKIGKGTKTPEERSREIESQVAAARLLRQQKETIQSKDDDDEVLDENTQKSRAGNLSAQALSKRIATSAKKMDPYRLFWSSMSDESKHGFLKLRVRDLREYLRLSKDSSASKTFSEVVGFAEKNKRWKFWPCCFCDEKFIDWGSRMQHLAQKHNNNIEQEVKKWLYPEVDADLADMIVNGIWKPVDTPRAIKIIEKHSNYQLASLVNEASTQEDNDYTNDQKWPRSDDIECIIFLEKIQEEFQKLLRHKFLSVNHLRKLIHYAIGHLQDLVKTLDLQLQGLDRLPLCICFLKVPQLKHVLGLLEGLSHFCGITESGDLPSMSYTLEEYGGNEIDEQIIFTGDSSGLDQDECYLQVILTPRRHHNAVADDGSTVHDEEVAVPPDSGDFVGWLYDCDSIRGGLSSWNLLQDGMRSEERKFFERFNKELDRVISLRRKGKELSIRLEALSAIQRICVRELEMREQVEMNVPQSCESLLRNWQEALAGEVNDDILINRRLELNEISNILREAQGDDCIREAIENKRIQLHAELDQIEIKVTRPGGFMRQLVLKYSQTFSLDYRIIMLPLLKAFMKAKLEKLFQEDAKQKSEAVAEAFLSELSLDAEKNTREGGNLAKLPKKTKRANKKKRDHRKVKDLKASRGDELNVVQEEKEEESHIPAGHDGYHPSSETGVAESADELNLQEEELKLQEEELKHKIQFQEEERKLEENLARLRLIEEESKQKNLAKQTKDAGALGDDGGKKNDIAVSQPPIHIQNVVLHDSSEIYTGSQVLNFEVERTARGSVMPHQDPLLGKSTMPDDFCRASASLSHGKVQQATLQAEKTVPLTTSKSVPSEAPLGEEDDLRALPTNVTFKNICVSDTLGPGLRNDPGEFNCFLNVIVQSFWHLRKLRDKFLSGSTSAHVHIGNHCLVCAFQEVFNSLSVASAKMQREAVSPTSLRNALSELNPNSNFFREVQINDAPEVLVKILECLHRSVPSGSSVSVTKSSGSKGAGNWNCRSDACITHKFFGMDILEKMICRKCGIESSQTKFTTFFYALDASTLREWKNIEPDLGKLFMLEEKKFQLKHFACDPHVGGCGEPNSLSSFISTPPHVFTLVLIWETASANIDDMSTMLKALSTEIDMAVLHEDLDPGNIHSLISMVCYFAQHFICFAYSHEHEKWIKYDDEAVKIIGGWDDVISACEEGHLLPQVLFFEEQTINKLPAQKILPLTTSQSVPSQAPSEEEHEEELRVLSTDVPIKKICGSDTLGTGMKNDHGENNCFLNVIVQCLWHLRTFRGDFLSRSRSEHNSIGHPCVVCALHEVLNSLSVASANMQIQAVSPSPLRIALSELYRDSNFFREGQMNDASEVLEAILDRLHQSFTPGSGVSDAESLGSWKCDSNGCIAHKLFGMEVHEMLVCNCCDTESRQQKYTSCSYTLHASALRSVEVFRTTPAKTPFDEFFKLVRKFNETFTCDPNKRGCNGYGIPCHILSTRPHVFTLVLGWETDDECVEHISATLEVLGTEIDLGVMFDGLDTGHKHTLISMVCYSGSHYICFVYCHDHEKWILYNDAIVKVIGSWDNVVSKCKLGHWQPSVLFFESVE